MVATAAGRRLKQDEFLLPPELTANKSSIRLTFINTPHEVSELWPGHGPPGRHGAATVAPCNLLV
eukprot:COSAG01_NODE_3399_length_6142_cov_11.969236_3_plen_65_part_00